MSGGSGGNAVAVTRDRRAERSAATRREILAAAWRLARERGLTALTMRDLGARVGMRAQSLYVYFPSKLSIYDAMFGEGNAELLRRLRSARSSPDGPVGDLRRRTRTFLQFCVEDPVRFQLLFQRHVPGFAPSAAAYAPAVEVLERGREILRRCGVDDPRAWDVWTALISGLAAQQNANEPGGRRWVRLADDVTDMYLSHYGTPGRERR